jgi:hypothetical protein
MTKQFLGKATKIVRKEQEKDIERNLGMHKGQKGRECNGGDSKAS